MCPPRCHTSRSASTWTPYPTDFTIARVQCFVLSALPVMSVVVPKSNVVLLIYLRRYDFANLMALLFALPVVLPL